MKRLLAGILTGCAFALFAAPDVKISVALDKLSANARIRYQVPASMPDPVLVRASFRAEGGEWKTASVNKFRSETIIQGFGRNASGTPQELIAQEQKAGQVEEYLAAGRERTLIWRTFPDVGTGKVAKGEVKVELFAKDAPEKVLASGRANYELDLSKVVVLDKFAGNPDIYPSVNSKQPEGPGWFDEGNGLDSVEKSDFLEAEVWRHGLRGNYAIYVSLPKTGYSMVSLRLTSDEYAQRFVSIDGMEIFYKIADVSDTHLVISEFYSFLSRVGDAARARLSYIKMVPVSDADAQAYAARFTPRHDKMIAAFFEPYSWSFSEYVRENGKFAEPMAAYREAGVDWVDCQLGRTGMRPLFPTDIEAPLVGATRGDAALTKDGKVVSGMTSLGTGRMGRTTDALRACLKYAAVENLPCSINFGAICYDHASPLRGDFANAHPEFQVGTGHDENFLDFKHPEVVAQHLKYFEAALQRGARRLTVNFKTYANGLTAPEQSLNFLRELRKLADRYTENDKRVEIMILFPIPGSRDITKDNKFQPEKWIAEKLVDYLVPCTLADSGVYFWDTAEYAKMVKGTNVKVLAEISVSSNAAVFPREMLLLADKFYATGADGLYIYQADARIVGAMTGAEEEERRWINVLGSTEAVKREIAREASEVENYSVDMSTNFTYLFCGDRIQVNIDGMKPVKVTLTLSDASGVKLETVRTEWPWVIGKFGVENHMPTGGPFSLKAVAVDKDGKTFTKVFTFPRINYSWN